MPLGKVFKIDKETSGVMNYQKIKPSCPNGHWILFLIIHSPWPLSVAEDTGFGAVAS